MELPHAQCRSGDRTGGTRRCGPVRARGGNFAAQPLSSPFAAFGRRAVRSLPNDRGERTSQDAAESERGRQLVWRLEVRNIFAASLGELVATLRFSSIVRD